jgi:zinc transport system substrate-binding protein
MRSVKSRTVLILILSSTLAACASACARNQTSSGGRPVVVTSFYPLEFAARQVGGARFDVLDLTPPGVEPHDLELSPDQVDELLSADVVLYLGEGFQPAVEDAVRSRGGDQVTVDLLRAFGSTLRPGAEGEPVDPHVWLDPVLMERIVSQTRAALSRAEPSRRAEFARNAARLQTRLSALDRAYRAGLTGCQRDVIVTSHAAFGYLGSRYGLRQEPISGISPEAEPDPKRLAEIEDLVRRDHITTIFTEELVSPRVAETIARETGVRTEVLSPLESLTPAEQQAGDDYLSVMRANLAKLRAALGCP